MRTMLGSLVLVLLWASPVFVPRAAAQMPEKPAAHWIEHRVVGNELRIQGMRQDPTGFRGVVTAAEGYTYQVRIKGDPPPDFEGYSCQLYRAMEQIPGRTAGTVVLMPRAPGTDEVQVDLLRNETVVLRTGLYVPVDHEAQVVVTRGGEPSCVAVPNTTERVYLRARGRAWSDVRIRGLHFVRPVDSDRVCVDAGVLGGFFDEDTSIRLATDADETDGVLLHVHVKASRVPSAVPVVIFLVVLVLGLGLSKKRSDDPIVEIAETSFGQPSYRGADAGDWRLTALSLADEPRPHAPRFALGSDVRGAIVRAHELVVVVPPEEEPRVVIGDVAVPPGTMIIDGARCFALLTRSMSRRLDELVPPAPAAVGQAREAGLTGGVLPDRAPDSVYPGWAAVAFATAIAGHLGAQALSKVVPWHLDHEVGYAVASAACAVTFLLLATFAARVLPRVPRRN